MPTTTDIKKLVINVLTENQYDAAVEEGVITDDQLSIITDYVDWMQVKQMPTPNYKEFGKIYQYIGPTTSQFIHGYFYECKKNSQGWSGELKITTGCVGLSFTFDDDTYIAYFSRLQDPLIAIQSWQYDGHDWIGSYTGPVSKTDLGTYGITYTGTPVITDQFRVELSESATYYWEQLDIQPEAELRWGNINGTLSDQADLQGALDSKLTKTNTASKVYGTDDQGNQTTYDVDSFGQVDDVQVDGVSVVTNKVAEIDLTGKVDKTNEINKLYGTDSTGAQTTYNKDDFYTTIREWADVA